MDANQQLAENLIEFISQTVSLNRRLQKKKVDVSTAKLAFAQLDKKRKGYLDLADVYGLCGEVTEDDLFVVFKWLDASKTGDVSYEDFQWAVAVQGPCDNKEKSNPVESVKIVITTFLENWDYSQGSKAKLGIDENNLSTLFKWICQTFRKNALTIEDLISVLQASKSCDFLCREQLKNIFKSTQFINQKTFVEAFIKISEGEIQTQQLTSIPQIKIQNPQFQSNEEQLLDDINNEYNVQRNYQPLKRQSAEDVNKFIQEKYQNNFCGRSNNHSSDFVREEAKVPERKDVDFKSGDIESLLSNIQKRRQELRKGSLQRKKLIDDALSRKKTNFTNLISPTNATECFNFEPKIYSRPVSTPKTNGSSQVYVNNFVDVTKNDFGKMFNRYRDERENVLNIETRMNQRKFNLQTKEPEWMQNRSSKFMEKAYSTQYDMPADRSAFVSQQSQSRNEFFKVNDNYMVDTPKFSQTAQERFFERPLSANKFDRFEQIKEKINHLPDRNVPNMQRENKQIDRIIEKYKNLKPESNQKHYSSSQNFEFSQQPQRYEEVQRPCLTSYLMNQSPSNMKGIENLTNQRTGPESYIQEQKGRLNGSIYQYRSSTGSIQKENLLKRAEEEAARKIHEIERKAKMKVLERKSAAGMKWIK